METIYLRSEDGRICTYHLSQSDYDLPCSVLYNRAAFQFELEGPFRLVSEGIDLFEDVPIRNYGISPDSFVQCLPVHILGGGSFPFADVEHPPEHGEFSDTAPDYRICENGISIEGVCTNTHCSAYNKRVLYRFGFGEWDLLKNKAYCPICKKQIVPETPYFSSCVYNITYTKADHSGGHTAWRTVKSGFDTFNVEKYKKVEYESLKIVAKKFYTILQETEKIIVVCPSKCCICNQDFLDATDTVVFECTHGAHKKCFDRLKKSLMMCPECESQIVVCHQPNQYRRYDSTSTSPFS